MKKLNKIILILILILLTHSLLIAQAPQKISFQAVMRNANNELISKKSIGIRISILQGTSNGIVVYTESQNVVSDFNGLISLQIGTGLVSFGPFSDIDWANGPYFIKTEADPTGGYDYSIIGSTELLSVPYAMFALNADVNDFLGSCYDWIDLSKLKLKQVITLNITKGLDFETIGHIIVSDATKNHFEGLVISYDKIKGTLVLNITEIVGSMSNNFWTIKIDGSRGYTGLPGINGTNGTDGINIISDTAISLKGLITSIKTLNALSGTNTGDQINITGNATTATTAGTASTTTKLATARNINGVAFDGSGDIIITSIADAGTLTGTSLKSTITASSLTSLGTLTSGAVPYSLLTGTVPTWNQNTTGNAATVSTNANLTGVVTSIGNATSIASGTITNSMIANTAVANLSGNNTGDQILPTLTSLGAEPVITAGVSSKYFRGDKTWQTLNAIVVGLENINNTSDANKPISTSTQTAFDLKSNIASPNFTGTPLVPTAVIGTNTQQVASTAFVLANSNNYLSTTAGNEIFTISSSDVIATGLTLSPPAGKYLVNFNSQYTIEPGDRTAPAVTDLNNAYTSLMAKPITNSTHSATYGAGETLGAGVYNTSGAVSTTGNLTLDANNNPNAEFIFRFGGALSTGAGFTVILINGASACNVYWIAEGAIALGTLTVIKGRMIANNGAITLGSTSTVNGSIYTSAGAIGIDASTISNMSGCLNEFGVLNSYAAFSKIGAITNIGTSNITGNIATNDGLVTGFSSATINGNIFLSGINDAVANFSIYQNGLLIPYSTRSRISSNNLREISLQALSNIATGEAIDIRWNIDFGKVKLQNRIFTIIGVR